MGVITFTLTAAVIVYLVRKKKTGSDVAPGDPDTV